MPWTWRERFDTVSTMAKAGWQNVGQPAWQARSKVVNREKVRELVFRPAHPAAHSSPNEPQVRPDKADLFASGQPTRAALRNA